MTTIHAHFNKVYGIDWHRTEHNKLLTCSLDKTVKQWEGVGIVESINKPTRTIFTDYPLLRARHTPFPNGIIAMPQHGSASLSLYEQNTYLQSTRRPQHTFVNNECEGGRLHEFLWRSRGSCDDGFDNRDFQLVTWATDYKLRLYSISSNTLKHAVGFEKGEPVTNPPSLSRMGAEYITFANGPVVSHDEQQVDKKRGKINGGTLSSLLKSSNPAKAGLTSLFQGQTRATMTARTVRRNTNQRVVSSVTWMHNVNIERRKTEGDDSTPAHDENEEFDLAAEVKAVGQKYPNIVFEEFDPHFRKIVVAFKAPWGDLEYALGDDQNPVRKTVFLRLTILFPDHYPGTEGIFDDDRYLCPLDITIEKTTAAIAPLMVDHLRVGLEQIANTYAYKGQPALSAVLSYALGDVDLEDIIEVTEDSDVPVKEPLQQSSSEEEEDDDSETGQLNKDLMLSQHSNTNIPLPARTLVRWSHSGMLLTVRFPRPAWANQNMTSSGLGPGQTVPPMRLPRNLKQIRSKDDIFETFGRIAAADGSESPSSSRISWESSSSPSSSSGSESDVVFRDFLPPLPWQKLSSRLRTKTSLPSSIDPINAYKTKAIVTIRDSAVAEFVPSKKVLAEEYLIFGDGPTVCLHNSEVARKHGYEDLADIWLLCRLILTNEVPLEILPQQHRRDQVLVLARRALVRLKRKDSGLDLHFEETESVSSPKLKGRVKWGHHPIVTWVIPALFEYFEKRADTQMLAMLSCVFSEPAAREGVPSAMSKMRQSHLPMAMEAPAFSLDYFASPDAAWSLFTSSISNITTPVHSKYATPIYEFGWHRLSRNLDTYGSHGSSNGPWGSDTQISEPGESFWSVSRMLFHQDTVLCKYDTDFSPLVTPYSTGNTPPSFSRAPTFRSATTVNTPYSTSPEQTQSFGKKISSAGISTALANLGKSFISSSPPVKSRPEDLSTSLPTSNVTWGTATFYSSGSHERTLIAPRAKQGKRASFGQDDRINVNYASDSDSDYDTVAPDGASERTVPIPPSAKDDSNSRIKVTLKNQDRFDEEASVSAPLLDMSKEWLYRAWREQYAEMLGCWDLISKRAEVLKFNGLVSYFPFDGAAHASNNVSMNLTLPKDRGRGNSRVLSNMHSRASTLAPPTVTTTPFRRSPISSPRAFSFNPEATEFTPGTSFPPINELPPPLPDVFISSEQYLRLSIPTPAAEPANDPFDLTLSDTKLNPAHHAHRGSRPSLSRGTSNISGRSSVNIPPSPSPRTPSRREEVYTCTICWIRVSGRFYLCPSCGHVAHFSCMELDEGFAGGEVDCVVGCGCGCGFETSHERSRIEEFLEGVRNWGELDGGSWLPEVEVDEEASTRAERAYRHEFDESSLASTQRAKKKKKGKKARLTGKSYF